MASLRDLGYRIMTLSKNNEALISELCSKLNFSRLDLNRLFYGKLSLTPLQIKTVASTLSVSVEDLINYKNQDSYKDIVHCMSSFSSQENCNEVLDIIDSYVDIKEALC